MGKYSIKDLERVSGIKAHTIRIWEQRYNLIVPERSDTNIRSYSDDDLKKILNVSILNRKGWKISKIAELTSKEISEKLLHISQDPDDLDIKLESLIVAMLDLDEALFNKVIDELILANSFEYVFTVVIRKLMEKAAIFWISGTISPAQEHFISNLVRLKLLSVIASIKTKKVKEAKKYILLLPEGEWHELSLLYLSYLLKKKGLPYLYLGQNTPIQSVQKALGKWDADTLIVSLTSGIAQKNMGKYLQELNDSFPGKEILVNHTESLNIIKERYPAITFYKDYNAFNQLIEEYAA